MTHTSLTLLTAIALASLLAGPLAPAQAGTAVSAPISATGPYLLAADDVLSIRVVNFPDLTQPSVVVTPDGTISLPLLPPVTVTGKTTADLARELSHAWDEYVVHPSVSVTLVSKRKQDVLLYGLVARAGTVEYRPGMHILEAVAEMGGALPTGELSTVTITHPSGLSQTLDLSHPETKGDSAQNIVLQSGDVIYVPERRSQFSVVGEVNRPGSFDYKDDMTVLDALTQVGGVRDTGDLVNATLVHDGKERPINLDALLNHGDLSLNTKLAAGDRILVPEIHNRTYVFGAVGHPGYYTFKPGDRVLDALNSSGPNQDADFGRINVIHVDKVQNTAAVQTVDIYKFLRSGDMKPNVPLKAGDVLYVPDKRHKFQIGDVFSALTSLSVVANTTRLLTGK